MTRSTPNRTQDWKRRDHLHFLHPFTDHKELGEKGGARIITRAEGVYIYDSDGNRILDGMAGLWCVNLGYGRQELVDAGHQGLDPRLRKRGAVDRVGQGHRDAPRPHAGRNGHKRRPRAVHVVGGIREVEFERDPGNARRYLLDAIAGYRPEHPYGEPPMFEPTATPFRRWLLLLVVLLLGDCLRDVLNPKLYKG